MKTNLKQLLVFLFVVVCGLMAASAPAATHTVEIRDFSFTPPVLSINVGDSVLWNHAGEFAHDTTSGNPPDGATWESELLFAGEFFLFTFDSAGSYPYACAIHYGSPQSGTSMTGLVTVASGPMMPPTVTITSPTNGTRLIAPASLSIEADASDSDGSVVDVQFFIDANPIGTDTSAPYSATASDLGPGNYTLTARATDNAGLMSTSAPVTITVEAAPIRLTSPSIGEGGLFQFIYNSTPGMVYVIEGSSTLDCILPMAPLSTNTATDSVSTFTDPEPGRYRMYRIRLGP